MAEGDAPLVFDFDFFASHFWAEHGVLFVDNTHMLSFVRKAGARGTMQGIRVCPRPLTMNPYQPGWPPSRQGRSLTSLTSFISFTHLVFFNDSAYQR